MTAVACQSSPTCACFTDTRAWLFDLDNTLYPAECNLFAQVDERMGAFIANLLGVDRTEARKIQKQYYYEHGTTLAGLMAVHGINPHDFLDYVHDIDHSALPDSPDLAAAIAALPGRKFIFTNGSRGHAEAVARKLGILHVFEEIYDIAASGFVPKPNRAAYDRFLTTHAVAAQQAAMFEDLPANLEVPHALGMATVFIRSSYRHPTHKALDDAIATGQPLPAHIHHVTADLLGFLQAIHWPIAGPESAA